MKPFKVIFVMGSGHCGATLLDLLLDSHSQIFGVGEMHAAKNSSICSCGKPGHECSLWSNALGAGPWRRQTLCKRSKFDFLFDRGSYYLTQQGPLERIDEKEFASYLISAYRSLLAQSGTRIIVDSSKEPERTQVLAASQEIEPVVIHLVRDNRGSTWTYIKKYKRLLPFFYMWAFSNLKVEVMRRRLSRISGGRAKFIYVRFSDLVADPGAVLKRLCSEIGIPYEPSMLEFDKSPHHQIDGNRTRFVPGHVIYPDAWRSDIPASLRVVCTLVFGWLNAYYTRYKRSFT